MPEGTYPPGTYSVTAHATDDAGLTDSDSGTEAVVGPTVAAPTIAGRTVTAAVTPAPGVAVASCEVTFRPSGGGTATSVAGIYDATAGTCIADAPASVRGGDYDVVVTATDANGDGGSSASTPLTVAGNADVPTVALADSGTNRVLTANVTPPAGGAVSACSFALTDSSNTTTTIAGTYDAAAGTCTATSPESSYPPGTYAVTVTANDDEGDAATDTGTFTITRPSIAPTTVDDRPLSAQVTPAPGTPIASCSFELTPTGGGAATTLAGTYDGSTATCTATVPASVPTGSYTIAARVTDDNGDSGTSTTPDAAVGQAPPAPQPTPTGVQIVDSGNNRLVAARITPAPGETITACTVFVRPAGSTGDYQAVASSYDAATGRCTGALPQAAYPPGTYDVRVVVTDSSGDQTVATGSKTVASATIGTPVQSGDGVVSAPVALPPNTTVVSCTLTFTPRAGGASVSAQGTWDAAAGACRAKVPSQLRSGAYAVKTTVRTSDGATYTGSGSVTIAGAAGSLLTACGTNRIVLTDVCVAGTRVRIAGAAASSLSGKKVRITFVPTGKVVATATVGRDGLFRTTAPLPPKALRRWSAARYVGRSGAYTSRALKLVRRSSVTRLAVSGSKVVFAGRIARPIKAGEVVRIQQQVSCGRYKTVASTRLRRDGTFSVTFAKPNGSAAVYRAGTHVPTRVGGRPVNRTFTIPAPVTL